MYLAAGDIQLQGWVLNLLLHWSALFEVAIVCVALALYARSSGRARPRPKAGGRGDLVAHGEAPDQPRR